MHKSKKHESGWPQRKAQVDEIIRTMDRARHTRGDIAKFLDEKKLYSPTGRPWGKSVSNYGLKEGLFARKFNTVAGKAGSTGKAYSPYNGLAISAPRRVSKRQKETISDREIEEIMTSNLDTGLKMKVVRIVALSRL